VSDDRASEHDPAKADLAQLASMVSHELRGTIASIRGLAGAGMHTYEALSDDERREFFQLIEQEARQLSRIADEISTTLKLDAGSLRYDFQAGSIGKLVREAAEVVDVGEHPLTIDTDEDLRGTVDRLRIAEVVGHLVDNAVKFSPPDAPIQVRVARDDSNAVIEVVDRGPGIPAERRGEAFNRFAKFRPAGYEEVQGAGLGLSLCRAHVGAHGGSILVNQASVGATMLRVTIPLER